MALDRISILDFRNHRQTALEDTARFNLLVGANGAGKTNVLEALSLLAPGRGLRRAKLPEMARIDGPGGFTVAARLQPADGAEPVQLGTVVDAAQPNRRRVRVNGAERSALGLSEWLSVRWLTPAMDGLFTDSAGARRRYLDRLGLATAPGHAALSNRYETALRNRNRLLSDDAPPDPQWLDALEAQLAEHGAAIAANRRALVEEVNPPVALGGPSGAGAASVLPRPVAARSLPAAGTTPTDNSKPAGLAARKTEAADPAPAAKETPMDWDSITTASLREHRADIASDIEASAKASADADQKAAVQTAVETERARIAAIDEIAMAGHEDLVKAAKADGRSAEQVALDMVKADKAAGASHLAGLRSADAAAAVPAMPTSEASTTSTNLSSEDQAEAQWDKDAALRSEFGGDKGAYLAFVKAEASGLARIKRAS